MKKLNHNKRGWIEKIIFLFFIFGLLLRLIGFIFSGKKLSFIKDNFRTFKDKEENELKEFECGKEDAEKYWHDSFGIFKDYFIPNRKNCHKPKILHTKSLVTIAFVMIMLKLMILSYVFFINPFKAWMSEVMTDRVLELINKERTEENVPSLAINPILSQSALNKANDMLAKNYFDHFSPDGKKPWDFIDRNQYEYLFVGENLAMNFTSAESVNTALMNSPSHKKNIMNSRYNEVGLAIVSGEINGEKTNILVEMFASKSQTDLASAKNSGKSSVKIASQPKAKTNNVQTTPAVDVTKSAAVKTNQAKPDVVAAPEIKTEVAGVSKQFTSDKTVENTPNLVEEFTSHAGSTETEVSPNNALNTPGNFQLIKMPNSDNSHIVFVSSIFNSMNYIFVAVLILMIMSLIVNILVKFRIQHKPVILQTLLLLLLISGLVYWKIDFKISDLMDILII
jgi:hypothetical protein